MRFRFRPEIMESFTNILRSDEMSSRLECVGNDELSAVKSDIRFNNIIVESLHKVDSLHKKIVAREPKINAYIVLHVKVYGTPRGCMRLCAQTKTQKHPVSKKPHYTWGESKTHKPNSLPPWWWRGYQNP